MTERKHPGERWESLIERQIREAREEGRFDDVEGAGRPLPDADAPYDPNWWTKRLIQRERLSDLPPALAIRRRVERELDRLLAIDDEAAVRRGLAELDSEVRRVNATATYGPPTTIPPLDVEALVHLWRDRRRAEPADEATDGEEGSGS